MSSIRLADVTFAFPQQHSLIESCTLDLGRGWTGLVGRNGSGKSTLLDLIDGTLAPTRGRVDTGGLRIVRCYQGLEMTRPVEELAHAWTSESLKWMSLLELDPGDFWRWEELSPGMRRRWQLAAALHTEPGALLLDEPTNHVDTAGREVLVHALRQFEGVGIVVSHDRELLDAVSARTVRIHRHEARAYPGAYTAARALWEDEENAELAELEATQDRRRSLEAELAQKTSRHASAVHSLSSRSRLGSIRDTDARSMSAKFRAQRAESSIARDKSVARARLDRVERELAQMRRPEPRGGAIFLDDGRCPRDFALRFETTPLMAGERQLLPHARLDLRRDERIWLQGPNGCGKTTLLRAALGACDLPLDRVLHVPQRLSVGRLRARFAALSPSDRQRALHVGAALMLDVIAVLDETALSPGETRKLALALGLVRTPWLVVLDEPTNDLDVDSIERLERALADYEGALLVVTHDAYFARAVAAEPRAFSA